MIAEDDDGRRSSAGERALGRRRALRVLAALGAVAGGCGKAEPTCEADPHRSPEDQESRDRVAYEERGPDPARRCDVCNQWVPPPSSDRCGGCRLFKGEVHPKGTCKLFASKG